MIVGLLGRKGVGKDTAADHLVENYGFEKTALAKPLKEALKTLFMFSEDQVNGHLKEVIDDRWNATPRSVLQFVGTDLFRNQIANVIPGIRDEFWVKRLTDECLEKKEKNPDIRIVVSDIRFPNEVDAIHKLGGCVIKIERPNVKNTDNHASEAFIDDLKGDYLIVNDKTVSELRSQVAKSCSLWFKYGNLCLE